MGCLLLRIQTRAPINGRQVLLQRAWCLTRGSLGSLLSGLALIPVTDRLRALLSPSFLNPRLLLLPLIWMMASSSSHTTCFAAFLRSSPLLIPSSVAFTFAWTNVSCGSHPPHHPPPPQIRAAYSATLTQYFGKAGTVHLQVPIVTDNFIQASLDFFLATPELLLQAIEDMEDSQTAFTLLRRCAEVAKITCLLRLISPRLSLLFA